MDRWGDEPPRLALPPSPQHCLLIRSFRLSSRGEKGTDTKGKNRIEDQHWLATGSVGLLVCRATEKARRQTGQLVREQSVFGDRLLSSFEGFGSCRALYERPMVLLGGASLVNPTEKNLVAESRVKRCDLAERPPFERRRRLERKNIPQPNTHDRCLLSVVDPIGEFVFCSVSAAIVATAEIVIVPSRPFASWAQLPTQALLYASPRHRSRFSAESPQLRLSQEPAGRPALVLALTRRRVSGPPP